MGTYIREDKTATLPPFTYSYLVDLDKYAVLTPSFLKVSVVPNADIYKDPFNFSGMSISLGFDLLLSEKVREMVEEVKAKVDPNIFGRTFGLYPDQVARDVAVRALDKLVRGEFYEDEIEKRRSRVVRFVYRYDVNDPITADEVRKFANLFEKLGFDKSHISPFLRLDSFGDLDEDQIRSLLLFFMVVKDRFGKDRAEVDNPLAYLLTSEEAKCSYQDRGATTPGGAKLFENEIEGKCEAFLHLRLVLPSKRYCLSWIEEWSEDQMKKLFSPLRDLSLEVETDEHRIGEWLVIRWSPDPSRFMPVEALVFFLRYKHQLSRIPVSREFSVGINSDSEQAFSFFREQSLLDEKTITIEEGEVQGVKPRRSRSITEIGTDYDFSYYLANFEGKVPKLEEMDSYDVEKIIYNLSLFVASGVLQRSRGLAERIGSMVLCASREKPGVSLLDLVWGEEIARLLSSDDREVRELTVWSLLVPAFLKTETPEQIKLFAPKASVDENTWRNLALFLRANPHLLEAIKGYIGILSELSFRAVRKEPEGLTSAPHLVPLGSIFRVSVEPKRRLVLFEGENRLVIDYKREIGVNLPFYLAGLEKDPQ